MNFSKTFFTLLCVFSLACSSVLAQSAEEQSSLNSSTQTVNSLPDESTIRLGDDAVTGTAGATAAVPARRGSSTVFVFFKMVFVLIIVVVCIYFAMNFMRKKMSGGITEDDTFLRKVAAISIAPGKSVQVITLLEHAYLLGVTDNSIDLLGEITDKELVDAMNVNADRNENASRARNFNDILSIFLNPKNASSEEKKNSNSKITDFFNSQREKINGGE